MSDRAIRILDPHLAAKIAAGEVIERPASVVRELVENALDAGAAHVLVEIDGGGMDRIAVTDDGSGIRGAEVELAFRRHATSKLVREADLNDLQTLGFRGEALPSIAAVSDVSCSTRARDEAVGTEYRILEGALERASIARQVGTRIQVERLFARFPARRKFLRSRAVEGAACLQAIAPLSLAFPEVQFTASVDGKMALRTPGNGSLIDSAVAVLGRETEPHLVMVPDEAVEGEDGASIVHVTGVCATGTCSRSNRSGLFVIVNRRPVQNRALAYAAVEAYGSLLQVGRQPIAVLHLTVPPADVDFNVHPSKLEVKLLRERAAYSAIQRALRSALATEEWPVAGWSADPAASSGALATAPSTGDWGAVAQALLPPAGDPYADPLGGGERLQDLRLLAQAGRLYLIAEGDAGLYLVDQHAAHERVLLEQMRAALSTRSERQLVLDPLVLEVPAEAVALADEAREELERLGFDIEVFGPRQVLVRSVPAILAQRHPGRVIGEVLAALAGNTHGLMLDQHAPWAERVALVLACKMAVRAGDTLQAQEAAALLRQLGEAQLCRTCAHGRPTAILLSHAQLEREFGRR